MKSIPQKLLVLLALLLVAPWFISRKFRVVRRVLIRARPADIFPLVNDLRHWPRWTAWSQREELHFSYEGAPSGVGAVQRWSNSCMDGMIRVVQSVPDERLAYDLTMRGGKHRLEGIIALEPAGDFTRVTWICKWDAGTNPYTAYFSLFMKRFIARDFSTGLQNLRRLAEQSAS